MQLTDLLSDNAKWALGLCVAMVLTLVAHRLALWRDRIKGSHKAVEAAADNDVKKQRPRFRVNDGSIPLTPLTYGLQFDAGKPGGALVLTDGVTARLDMQIICCVTNPYRAVFGITESHFMDALTPVIYARTHQLVEAHSLATARSSRKAFEAALRTELEPEFKKVGVTIEGIYIGALEPI